MAKVIPSKSKTKIQLVLISVVAIAAVYSYFAYSKDLFPFTKEFKAKLNKLFKGKEPLDENLEDILGEGLVDEFGNIKQPGGGTGALDPSGASGLGEAMIKGDPQMAAEYQQGLYKQLFLPFEDAPMGGGGREGDDPHSAIIRGGDIPSQSQMGNIPQPYKYPFPVDERLYDMYGLYPPGGSYGGRNPYSPFYPTTNKPRLNPAVLNCNNCPPGQTWDNCGCRCADEDAPRLMCYRPECECNPPGGGGGGGGEPNCPEDYVFDSCRCKCVPPDMPQIQCIRNCTECPGDEWYSFCTNQCVSGRQRQCEPEVIEREIEIPDMPDIPEWLPDSVTAEIGDLRDLRDRLLAEIDELRAQLEDEIDELNARLEEERRRRQELEELVAEIREEMDEEREQGVPLGDRINNNNARVSVIAEAESAHATAVASVNETSTAVASTRNTISSTTNLINTVDSRIRTYASRYSTYSRTGSTTATAGSGGATACAGSTCATANKAARVGDLTAAERNFAFSKLQNKAMRMNTMKTKPTAHLKNKQFLNILPPVVQRRHFASRMTIS